MKTMAPVTRNSKVNRKIRLFEDSDNVKDCIITFLGVLFMFLVVFIPFALIIWEDIKTTPYHVQATFVLPSPEPITSDEQLFIAHSLERSFYTAFQLEKVLMTPVLNDKDTLPLLLTPTVEDGSDSTFKWVVGWTMKGRCSACAVVQDMLWARAPRHFSPTYHQQWETNFCTVLRTGSSERFRKADSCRITISTGEPKDQAPAMTKDTLTTMNVAEVAAPTTTASTATASSTTALDVTGRRQVIFQVRASMDLSVDDDLSDDELLFTTDSLRGSYNEIHQHDEDIYMDRATLQQHYDIPHTTTSVTMMRGSSWSSSWKLQENDETDFTYIFTWEASAVCHYCALHSDHRNHVVLELDTRSKDMMKQKQQDISKKNEHEQELWELALCAKLRTGPFPIFKSVKSCAIKIYMDTPAGQMIASTTAK